jgi:hypothetical protein
LPTNGCLAVSRHFARDYGCIFNEGDINIDDIGVFSNDWDMHCALLTNIVNVLETNDFTVHAYKCSWAVQETDWLGYWLTPTGLKPCHYGFEMTRNCEAVAVEQSTFTGICYQNIPIS